MSSGHEEEWHLGTWENEGGWVQDFDRSPGYFEFTTIQFDSDERFVVLVSGTYEFSGTFRGPTINQFLTFPAQEMQANE